MISLFLDYCFNFVLEDGDEDDDEDDDVEDNDEEEEEDEDVELLRSCGIMIVFSTSASCRSLITLGSKRKH